MSKESTPGKIDITLNGFRKNLKEASIDARDFAKTMVQNPLPDEIAFEIINGVMDEELLEDDEVLIKEAVFDGTERFTLDQVVEKLWRNGLVPVWINVSVKNYNDKATILGLECGGRFSAQPELMYHVHEGRAPFHVLSPSLPPNWKKEDGKFDLFWRKNL